MRRVIRTQTSISSWKSPAPTREKVAWAADSKEKDFCSCLKLHSDYSFYVAEWSSQVNNTPKNQPSNFQKLNGGTIIIAIVINLCKNIPALTETERSQPRSRSYHSSGSQSQVIHCRGPCSNPGQSMWYLIVVEKVAMGHVFLRQYLSTNAPYSFIRPSKTLCNLST